jgi:hypothetical protein
MQISHLTLLYFGSEPEITIRTLQAKLDVKDIVFLKWIIYL